MFLFQANKKTLDETSIIANAMVMLLAGYETTMNSIAFVVWELVRNPKCLEKLM